jgi:hypothetical protein
MISTALLQSVAEIGTQGTMKSSRNMSSSTNEMLHTDLAVISQRTRVNNIHAMDAKRRIATKIARRSTNSAAIGANRPLSSKAELIVVMDRLNRRRAKQSGSAEVRIKFAMMSSQCKIAREWETSTYTRNIGVRASTCNRHVNNKMTVWSHEV